MCQLLYEGRCDACREFMSSTRAGWKDCVQQCGTTSTHFLVRPEGRQVHLLCRGIRFGGNTGSAQTTLQGTETTSVTSASSAAAPTASSLVRSAEPTTGGRTINDGFRGPQPQSTSERGTTLDPWGHNTSSAYADTARSSSQASGSQRYSGMPPSRSVTNPYPLAGGSDPYLSSQQTGRAQEDIPSGRSTYPRPHGRGTMEMAEVLGRPMAQEPEALQNLHDLADIASRQPYQPSGSTLRDNAEPEEPQAEFVNDPGKKHRDRKRELRKNSRYYESKRVYDRARRAGKSREEASALADAATSQTWELEFKPPTDPSYRGGRGGNGGFGGGSDRGGPGGSAAGFATAR